MPTATNETAQYLPIPWTITSLNESQHPCPSPSSLLSTFATVNAIVSLLSVLFGHRRVVQELTCGSLGRKGSQSWKIFWIMPVGLQLSANACIALLIKKTDGYAADFSAAELMLWLTARPRLSWIVLGAFAFQKQVGLKEYPRGGGKGVGSESTVTLVGSSYEQVRGGSAMGSPDPRYYQSSRSLVSNPYVHVPTDEAGTGDSVLDYPWWSAFMTQFIAEFVLQSMALYVMGRTAHYGSARNFYSVHLESYWKMPEAARMMYSGALYYLVAGSLFLIFAFFFIVYQMLSSTVKALGKGNTAAIMFSLWFLLISTWLGSWLFWSGFVKLAGDQYCPPKLIQQGVIWTFFSTSGIIIGAGV